MAEPLHAEPKMKIHTNEHLLHELFAVRNKKLIHSKKIPTVEKKVRKRDSYCTKKKEIHAHTKINVLQVSTCCVSCLLSEKEIHAKIKKIY